MPSTPNYDYCTRKTVMQYTVLFGCLLYSMYSRYGVEKVDPLRQFSSTNPPYVSPSRCGSIKPAFSLAISLSLSIFLNIYIYIQYICDPHLNMYPRYIAAIIQQQDDTELLTDLLCAEIRQQQQKQRDPSSSRPTASIQFIPFYLSLHLFHRHPPPPLHYTEMRITASGKRFIPPKQHCLAAVASIYTVCTVYKKNFGKSVLHKNERGGGGMNSFEIIIKRERGKRLIYMNGILNTEYCGSADAKSLILKCSKSFRENIIITF